MANNGQIPVVIVAGPTCGGKSALALDIAGRFDGTVINADSMQVYRELRILTARPEPGDEARVPHRLYGVLSAAEACSAARWRELAIAAIDEASSRGRLPILCGGAGLYIKALTEGLSPIPDVPEALRRRVRQRFEGADAEALHTALQALDPASAAMLSPTDPQRLLRALEVFEATGRPLIEWRALGPAPPPPQMRFHTILVLPQRQAVYAACDARLEKMLQEGALEEIRRLRALGLDPELPAMKALGVPGFLRHLEGEEDLEIALAAVQQATRQYVKRQFTWFTRQIVSDLIIRQKYSENVRGEIFSFICKKVLTHSD